MKAVPIEWEEPKPQREHGRGFKNEDVTRGYMSEPMYDYPEDGRNQNRRKWRKDDEKYDNGYDD